MTLLRDADASPVVGSRIFDALTTVWSTCRDCEQPMVVINLGDTSHPTCEWKPTPIERLERGWLSAVNAGDEKSAELTRQEIDKAPSDVGTLLNMATTYASWGWKVFPLAARSKAPAIPKDRGGHGVLDATDDVDRVYRWWSRHPQHNIGVATGHMFDVIDVDPKNGGVSSFAKLLQARRIPEVHAVVSTAGDPTKPGGLHLYVLKTGRGNYAGVAPGVDYRGLGGYVVAPPSTLGQRHSWAWSVSPSPMIKRDIGEQA